MSEEIGQAVQIIRVAYDGIDIAMRVGSGTIEQMKNVLDVLIGVLEREKMMGKTNMKQLLQKGGDMQVLQFATEDRKKIERMAKKYGLLYSVLPDINKEDGMSEIVFHTEAVPRANMMIQKLKSARLATLEDYLKNGDKSELEKALSFLKGQVPESETPTLTEDQQALAQRMQMISATEGKNLLDITLNKELILEENDHAIKTRVPGTWGDNIRFLWIDKTDAMEIHDGKTILTFLDSDKEYKLYSKDNQVASTIQGKELYGAHYDPVAKEVRKRYKKEEQRKVQRENPQNKNQSQNRNSSQNKNQSGKKQGTKKQTTQKRTTQKQSSSRPKQR